VRFTKTTRIGASAETVFAFHERPDALALLQPPWAATAIVQPPASLAVGTRVILRTKLGPFTRTIEAEHVAYEPGRMFADRMVRGPFPTWLHRHVVTPEGPDASLLTDDVEYELPLGIVGRLVGGPIARRELERLFAYRHDVTRRECERFPPSGEGG
jgi:ligand-binding SRPBCC domain-containing protein